MKTLFPKQLEVADRFIRLHKNNRHTLDSSDVGTGKTVVAAYMAKELGLPVGVICPKAVIPAWDRELIEMGVEPEFVLNYEKLRTGKTPFVKKKGKRSMKWGLPDNTLVLVDEVHKCKGPYTQNAQLLISLVTQRFHVHAMSATAAEDPTEMRALGYMLGLHFLNNQPCSWTAWMGSYGCYQDHWGKWHSGSREHLKKLHERIYEDVKHEDAFPNINWPGDKNYARAAKLRIEDFPHSFKNTRVFVEPVECKNANRILEAYESLGVTPAVVEEYIETGTVTDSAHTLVNILRARQLAESFKVPCLADMARDYVAQGMSVVLFVNFRETADALCESLGCSSVVGGQSIEQRQEVIDGFQEDRLHTLVVNIAAGGTGLSLHDTRGKRPRISLISPTFSAKEHLQALGRIHRNGAKSDAIQKILVAADSVEEDVLKSIKRKSANLRALHG